MNEEFKCWLARYLKTTTMQVSSLIENKLAVEFLISWSIFESVCFDGFCTVSKLREFSEKTTVSHLYRNDVFSHAVTYIHNRYQDEHKLRHLLHRPINNRFTSILNKKVEQLIHNENAFLLLMVVYRYRNNIFHGNKGVTSWLAYEEQIRMCCQIMQMFVDMSGDAHKKLECTDVDSLTSV